MTASDVASTGEGRGAVDVDDVPWLSGDQLRDWKSLMAMLMTGKGEVPFPSERSPA